MKRLSPSFLTSALLAGLALLAAAPSQAKTIHEERSVYRNILVDETGDQRCLLFRARLGVGRESCQYISNPDKFVFEYAGMMISSLYLNSAAPKRVLIIGEGGATLPMAVQKLLPNAHLDVVELDKAVDNASKKYFGFKPGKNTTVTIQDGRNFVKRSIQRKQTWDLVMLDAFEDDYIPEHMETAEFLGEVKQVLAPGGVLAANTWSSLGLYPYESATYASVFGKFYNLKRDNRIILVRPAGLPSMDVITANSKTWETQFQRTGVGAGVLLPMFSTQVDWDTSTRALTDQWSPANVLQMRQGG
ncbi:MAG: spermidine synthase [Caulobacteraceae bacterium]|nr:spermidine synthase [Caulobacteraceae bacterium]